jgi:hypothetical protein
MGNLETPPGYRGGRVSAAGPRCEGRDRSVEAFVGLAGALIGGVLVLLADVVRRRSANRGEQVSRLAEVSVAYAAVIGRLFAQARDAFERSERPAHQRPERAEASVRFFMTPGMEELYPHARGLMNAYLTYAALDPAAAKDRDNAMDVFFDIQRAFEEKVRKILRRGTITTATTFDVIRGLRG